jgi:SMC interacting uncharacterized protein involved in chromosome segregation
MGKDFSDSKTIEALASETAAKLRPLVADQVQARNGVRQKHLILTGRIEELEQRQTDLEGEIQTLRDQGADRVAQGKGNQAISLKISTREAEHRENAGWLEDLRPKAQTLAKETEGMDHDILNTLRTHLRPLHQQAEARMNTLLAEASVLRHSWVKSCLLAIDQVGEKENLASGITAPNVDLRLKLHREASCFVSVDR